MNTENVKARAPESMGGLAKGLALIEVFSKHRRAMSLSELAQEVGLSRASARRCLLTLVDLGYVRLLGTVFSPTPRMLRLGAAYFEMPSLPQLAQPHLDRARTRLNESVSLGVIEGNTAIIVARAEVNRPVATFARLGATLPIYASAVGRVLMPAQGEAEMDAYLSKAEITRYTEKTVTAPAEIKALFLLARAEGYSLSVEQFELGIFAMAVPVFDAKGMAVAAVSISAAIAKISPEEAKQEYLPVLREQAAAISRTL